MTPEQKLRHAILIAAGVPDLETITVENIDERYNEAYDQDLLYDAKAEVRASGEETPGLPSPYSRHYESKAVAAKMPDGSWVGWIYWYGGGKHGEPDAVEWMEYAYDLEVTEEEKLMVVRTFKKKEPAA
jgi:hypothetical protein